MYEDLLNDEHLRHHSHLFRSIGSDLAIKLFHTIESDFEQLRETFHPVFTSIFPQTKNKIISQFYDKKKANQQYSIVNEYY